jgi:DNA-binding NarL/FixJ family response regulator
MSLSDSPAAPLRVLIAEDQYLLREGTRRLLEEAGLSVVGVASDYQTVIDQARNLLPQVVLMDIRMPPTYTMEGIRAAHQIKAERPETGVVIMTQHDDESYVWALLKEGVAGYGYLHKVRVGDVDQLVRALQEVAAGGSVLDPRIVESLLALRSRKPGSRLSRLSPAELEVLKLMAEGNSNTRIAQHLYVALGTVEKRIAAVFTKLGLSEEPNLNRRVAAVLIYLRESATSG